MNSSKRLDLELDPRWNYPILETRTLNLGYEIARKVGEPRTMSLAIDAFAGLVQSADSIMVLTSVAKEQYVTAIETFWSGGSPERQMIVEVR